MPKNKLSCVLGFWSCHRETETMRLEADIKTNVDVKAIADVLKGGSTKKLRTITILPYLTSYFINNYYYYLL